MTIPFFANVLMSIHSWFDRDRESRQKTQVHQGHRALLNFNTNKNGGILDRIEILTGVKRRQLMTIGGVIVLVSHK